MKTVLITLMSALLMFSPLIQADENAGKVLAEAKTLFKQAKKLQGAWVTTGKLIKKAEAAAKKGDGSTALKLAMKAKTEALLSIKQAQDQAKNWAEPAYIRR